METVRLRLVFEDRDILMKSHKREGLNRCWLLLQPHIRTISDLAIYIVFKFSIPNVDANGLILSMDGFVLPPFESTCILKDNDIVCIKKNKGIIKSGSAANCGEAICTVGYQSSESKSEANEELAIVEKQPILTGSKLLANEELERETEGYESESEGNEEDQSGEKLHLDDTPHRKTASKKRKASKKIHSSKKKKRKCAIIEKCFTVPEDVENDVHEEQNESFQNHRILHEKNFVKMNESSDEQDELEDSSYPKFDKSSNILKSKPDAKMSRLVDEDKNASMGASEMPSGTPKVPSRSARRKKAKRKWLRELVKADKKELSQMQVLKQDSQQSPDKNNYKSPKEHQQSNQDTDAEENIVPIIIRPGHIRFEPLEDVDADQTVQKIQASVETFHWNGITSKKKGQKWGKEKSTTLKWNDYSNTNEECFEMLAIEERLHLSDAVDFDKLSPCATLPKKGDVVAYRLIELSPSWTPEISSFRIGKVSWYNSESNRILLLSVPEYPIVFEKKIDEEETSDVQPDTSLYAEDGSLEIDYTSLIDIRIVKNGILNPEKAVTGGISEVHMADQDTASGFGLNNADKETHGSSQGNGEVKAWKEISQAFRAKKEQLSQNDNYNKNERSSRSYKGLRSSALGPTLAFLRAQNEI